MTMPIVRCGFQASILILLAGSPIFAQIIDHTDVDGVAALPQASMDAIGGQNWFFSHASVGGNLLSGMAALHATNPGRYQLGQASVGFDGGQNRADNPPTPTAVGTIYECDRGNPGWQDKITIFQNSVNTSGWRSGAAAIAMNKFCFIDQDAEASQYVDTLAALEAAWPATIFVYTTMPLTTAEDAENVLRNQYNAAVRQYCQSHARLLFDIADMESHNPAGAAITFTSGGQTYQKLHEYYSSDGGHLNAAGCRQLALGWYAVAAAIAAANDCNDNGVLDGTDIAGGTSLDANGNGIPDECPADAGGSDGDPQGSSPQPCGSCGPSAGTMMPAMLLGWSWMKRRRRPDRSPKR